MDLTSKRILVTGAGGFIGSHLTEELVRRGHRVRAFVRYNSMSSWGWLETAEKNILDSLEDIFAGDVRDPHGVKQAVQGCDVVFHLAALISIPYSYHSPDAYVDTNIKGALNILQASREADCEKIVVTSTSEVYGTARYAPIDESHPLQGQSPYSASKIGADMLALSFHQSFAAPVAVARPFNTYGPRQSARAVIPTIIMQLASGREDIKIGALHPTRDFNFVMDIVAGFIAIAKSEAAVGEVINLGANYEISIGEIAQLIAEVMGKKVNLVSEEARFRPPTSEVERLWAANDKARRLLDWSPAYGGLSGLRQGLQETVAWFAVPENLKRYKVELYNI